MKVHKYMVKRVNAARIYSDNFEKQELLTVEQIDTISYNRALEVVGRTPPLEFYIDGQEVWSYKNNRGVDLNAKYADVLKPFQELFANF